MTVHKAIYQGYYTTPYSIIVKPASIWTGSKYFLRRWTAYLGPMRCWTVTAVQQVAYQKGDKHKACVYDSTIYNGAGISKSAYYNKLKPEMGRCAVDENTGQISGITETTPFPLSLFVAHSRTQYQRKGPVTKPAPTHYWVRMDTPLTPADADHLSEWLGQGHDKESLVIELLDHAIKLASSGDTARQLLAPQQQPYLDSITTYTPITIYDIIQTHYPQAARSQRVKELADALQHRITEATRYQGTHYFRQKWVKALGFGPAVLLTYLRSFCFHNDQETRDIVTAVKLSSLADSLGTTPKNIRRWLKTLLDPQTVPEQPFRPFLSEVRDGSRWPRDPETNEVLFTYRVQLQDPITPKDWPDYTALLDEMEAKNVLDREGQTRTHTQRGRGTNTDSHSGGVGQTRTHVHEGSGTNVDSYKYYNILLEEALKKDSSTFGAAANDFPDLLTHWHFDTANQSFAAVAVGDINGFCDALGIHGGKRPQVVATRLTVEQAVAWHLYALTQRRLKNDDAMRRGYIINRVYRNETPPPEFEHLATLSWAWWRSYACAHYLPPIYREPFMHKPGYAAWSRRYGRMRPDELPFGVGTGVAEFMDMMLGKGEQPGSAHAQVDEGLSPIQKFPAPSKEQTAVWQHTLSELESQMTKATFNAWLRDARLMAVEDGRVYVIVAKNSYAQDWLVNRLQDTILRTLQVISGQEETSLEIVVAEQTAAAYSGR